MWDERVLRSVSFVCFVSACNEYLLHLFFAPCDAGQWQHAVMANLQLQSYNMARALTRHVLGPMGSSCMV